LPFLLNNEKINRNLSRHKQQQQLHHYKNAITKHHQHQQPWEQVQEEK